MMKKMQNVLFGFFAVVTLSTSALCVFVMTPDDEAFVKAHPRLPRENHTSSLESYTPKNKSQIEALKWARRIMSLEPGTAAGLWLWGDVGIGKTHLAVGIAKALEAQGKKVLFFQTDLYVSGMPHPIQEYDAIVLDVMNLSSQTEDEEEKDKGEEEFLSVILKCSNHRKKIVLAINTDYKSFLTYDFLGYELERETFKDRVQHMFKVVHLEGASQRSAVSWVDQFSDKGSVEEGATDTGGSGTGGSGCVIS